MHLNLSGLASAETIRLLGNAIYLLIWLADKGTPGPTADGWAVLFSGRALPWAEAQETLGIGRSRRYEWVRYLKLAGLIRERQDGGLDLSAVVLANIVSDSPENRTHTDTLQAENVSDIPDSRNPDTPLDVPLPRSPSPLNLPGSDEGEKEERAPPAGEPQPGANWRQWYVKAFAGHWPRNLTAEPLDNAAAGGMAHEVIIRVIQAAVDLRKPNPLAWAATTVAGMFAAGVRTAADAEEYERMQAAPMTDGRKGGRRGKPATEPRLTPKSAEFYDQFFTGKK